MRVCCLGFWAAVWLVRVVVGGRVVLVLGQMGQMVAWADRLASVWFVAGPAVRLCRSCGCLAAGGCIGGGWVLRRPRATPGGR